ncbi:hypothetical protein [Flexibacterium corallicola]|uniref:hypothetical protein n=1 Tax=Flexibacterium corallicola TaxID=3037259 RepID=UPI00286F155B|nr:hypothetical protein [Pseudovibrio sp. M1P-2-3]
MAASVKVQIYLNPDLPADQRTIAVWAAAKKHDRPQVVFRKIIDAGIDKLVEQGDLPQDILNECNLTRSKPKSRPKAPIRTSAPNPEPQPMAPAPVVYAQNDRISAETEPTKVGSVPAKVQKLGNLM